MIWFQRENETATKYVNCIKEVDIDSLDSSCKESVDIEWISDVAEREKPHIDSFTHELYKRNAVFINPNIVNGAFIVGLRALGVCQSFNGNKTIKAVIVTIPIPKADTSKPSPSAPAPAAIVPL
eukprot:UN10169